MENRGFDKSSRSNAWLWASIASVAAGVGIYYATNIDARESSLQIFVQPDRDFAFVRPGPSDRAATSPSPTKPPKPRADSSTKWMTIPVDRNTIVFRNFAHAESMLGRIFIGERSQPLKAPLKSFDKLIVKSTQRSDATVDSHQQCGLPLELALQENQINDTAPFWLTRRKYNAQFALTVDGLSKNAGENIDVCKKLDNMENVWVIDKAFMASGRLVQSEWDRGARYAPQITTKEHQDLNSATAKYDAQFVEFTLADAHALCAQLRTAELDRLVREGHSDQESIGRLQQQVKDLGTELTTEQQKFRNADGALKCIREAMEALQPTTGEGAEPLDVRLKKCLPDSGSK